MLRHNQTAGQKARFREIFEHKVKERTGKPYWKFPAGYEGFMDTVMSAVDKCGAKVEDFIAAQFQALTKEFCYKTFSLSYPPLGCFCGPKARERYHKYMLTVDSHKVKTNTVTVQEELDRLETRRSSLLGRGLDVKSPLFTDKACLLMTSGVMDTTLLAYMLRKNDFSLEQVKTVLEFLANEAGQRYVHEEYNEAVDRLRGVT